MHRTKEAQEVVIPPSRIALKQCQSPPLERDTRASLVYVL